MQKYEEAAVKFVAAYPISSTISNNQLVNFAKEHKNGLATDLLVGDHKKQAGTIRRHLNQGGASFDLTEDTRFQIVVIDAKIGQMEVVAFADYVRNKTETAVQRSIQGAMNPLKQGRREINQVKRDELSDERREELEKQLEEIVEAATPMSTLLTEIAFNKLVKRLIAKGFSRELAHSIVELGPAFQGDLKMIKNAKF